MSIPKKGVPSTPYAVLKLIFENSNLDDMPAVDKADFNMAISKLGVSPTQLDVPHVFDRLDDGSGLVTVDKLYEAIKENIKQHTPEDDIVSVLCAAVLKTFQRERRASLSILQKYMD